MIYTNVEFKYIIGNDIFMNKYLNIFGTKKHGEWTYKYIWKATKILNLHQNIFSGNNDTDNSKFEYIYCKIFEYIHLSKYSVNSARISCKAKTVLAK